MDLWVLLVPLETDEEDVAFSSENSELVLCKLEINMMCDSFRFHRDARLFEM